MKSQKAPRLMLILRLMLRLVVRLRLGLRLTFRRLPATSALVALTETQVYVGLFQP